MLTIVMYHYVRDLQRSRFPRIKGRSLETFRGQLEYLSQHHTVVTMEEVVRAVHGQDGDLPEDAALLTFDDGFIDHYTYVLPPLEERGWQGSFFVPAGPVFDREVLDVHKIHFVLAACSEPKRLVGDLDRELHDHQWEHDLLPSAAYWQQHAIASRFDPPEIIYLKRMLQNVLPLPLRRHVTAELFRRYVTHDEAAFAEELYLSLDQLRFMHRQGMHIGVHGRSHCWLDSAPRDVREQEIDGSLQLLQAVGTDDDYLTISYPYGAHDESLRAMLLKRGFQLGLTTEVAAADLSRHDPMALPRLDTNDLPTKFALVPLAAETK